MGGETPEAEEDAHMEWKGAPGACGDCTQSLYCLDFPSDFKHLAFESKDWKVNTSHQGLEGALGPPTSILQE